MHFLTNCRATSAARDLSSIYASVLLSLGQSKLTTTPFQPSAFRSFANCLCRCMIIGKSLLYPWTKMSTSPATLIEFGFGAPSARARTSATHLLISFGRSFPLWAWEQRHRQERANTEPNPRQPRRHRFEWHAL